MRVQLDFNIQNRDSRFAGVMTRGWGPGAGAELGLRSARVEIRQWAQRVYSLGVPMPTSYHGHTNEYGAIRLRVAKGGDGFGGATSVRGESGFCIDLANNAGAIRHFLLPVTVCDFSSLDVEVIGSRGETRTGTSVFENFERDSFVDVNTGNFELTVLNEATDTFDYARGVVGECMKPARILTGTHATVLSAGGNTLWAPCFGFGSTIVDAGAILALGIPLVGPAVSFYLSVVATTDIVVPDGSAARTTRGKITHEYGHYVTCNLVHAYDENLLTFTTLTLETIAGGTGNPSADEEPRVVNEALADFFAGQVVGGADYIVLGNADGGGMTMCNNSGNQCWDGNQRLESRGEERIGRLGTLIHDAFDGHPKLTLAPTNGDVWDQVGLGLRFTPVAYGDAADEAVVLGGPDVATFIDEFLGSRNLFGAFRVGALEVGLGRTVREHYSWCVACEMFLPHHLNTAGMSQQDRWQACVNESRVSDAITRVDFPLGPFFPPIIDGVPDEDLRINAADCSVCGPRERSDANGACQACGADEVLVGNACNACPTGSIPSGSGCVPCGANEVSVAGACVACGFGQGPDRATNTCQSCPADAVIDWPAADPACHTARVVETSAPGDICPTEFWVDAINLNGASSGGRTSDFSIQGDLATDIAVASQCHDTDVFVAVGEVQGAALVNIGQAASENPGVCVPEPPPLLSCLFGRCLHDARITLPFAQVAAGRTSVRIRTLAKSSSSALPASLTLTTSNCVTQVPR